MKKQNPTHEQLLLFNRNKNAKQRKKKKKAKKLVRKK